jgi:hypothetical protein
MKLLAWESLSRDVFTPRLAYFAPISLRLRLLGAGFSLQMSFQLHKPTQDFSSRFICTWAGMLPCCFRLYCLVGLLP